MREPFPVGGAGLVMFGIGGLVGNFAADFASRAVMGMDPTTATSTTTWPKAQQNAVVQISNPATYNDYAQAQHPTMASIGLQLLLSVLGMVGGFAFKAPVLKALSYGFGFGALFHLSTQLINAFVMEPLMSGSKTWGPRLYQHEWNANGAFGSGTMSGQEPRPAPQMGAPPAGAPRQLPAARPSALASMARSAVPGAMGAFARAPGPGFGGPGREPPPHRDPQPHPGNGQPGCKCGGSCEKCKPDPKPKRDPCPNPPPCDVLTDMGQPPAPAPAAAPAAPPAPSPAAPPAATSSLVAAVSHPLMQRRMNITPLRRAA